MPTNLPIGIFDSGVGGLTVMAAVRQALPHEAIVYLGDTARVPYGTRSGDVVRRYAVNCARFLAAQGAKLLIIACNTATAHALPHLQDTLTMPVMGVIEPGAALAAATTRNQHIGVIGTEGTIASGSYQRALARLAPQAKVSAAPCPLLVPLAEEGLVEHPATELLAAEYIKPLVASGIDTLVLGCTHYPILRPLLQRVAGDGVTIIDSATAVARAVQVELQQRGWNAPVRPHEDRIFATDLTTRLQRVGSAFLGAPIDHVELVDIATA
jgi:glutamate racemase